MKSRNGIFLLMMSCAISFAEEPAAKGVQLSTTDIKVPKDVVINGVKFVFSEEELLSHFEVALDGLEESLAKKKANPDDATAASGILLFQRKIGFCILAAAEFASKSDELYKLLNRGAELLGPNEQVPGGLLPFNELYMGMAAVSFIGASGNDTEFPDSEHLALYSTSMTFNQLVHWARTRIEARSQK